MTRAWILLVLGVFFAQAAASSPQADATFVTIREGQDGWASVAWTPVPGAIGYDVVGTRDGVTIVLAPVDPTTLVADVPMGYDFGVTANLPTGPLLPQSACFTLTGTVPPDLIVNSWCWPSLLGANLRTSDVLA